MDLDGKIDTLVSSQFGFSNEYRPQLQRRAIMLDLDQNRFGGQPAQAWVGVEASAEGRYSVGFPATPVNDLCAVTP